MIYKKVGKSPYCANYVGTLGTKYEIFEGRLCFGEQSVTLPLDGLTL